MFGDPLYCELLYVGDGLLNELVQRRTRRIQVAKYLTHKLAKGVVAVEVGRDVFERS